MTEAMDRPGFRHGPLRWEVFNFRHYQSGF